MRVKDVMSYLGQCNPDDEIIIEHLGRTEVQALIEEKESTGTCECCGHDVYVYSNDEEIDANVNLGYNGELEEITNNHYAKLVTFKVKF